MKYLSLIKEMENLCNKSQGLKNKDYFERFAKLNIYSYTKPNNNKLYIGAKPIEVYRKIL